MLKILNIDGTPTALQADVPAVAFLQISGSSLERFGSTVRTSPAVPSTSLTARHYRMALRLLISVK